MATGCLSGDRRRRHQPAVNTQFNYIDVGVNIDVTPRRHATYEVTLKLAMDISAVDSYQNIGGIQQPVIGQRKNRARDPHARGRSQYPRRQPGGDGEQDDQPDSGTGIISFFKYFFSTENKQRQDNELVFMLIRTLFGHRMCSTPTLAPSMSARHSISLHRSNAAAPEQPAAAPGNQPTSAQPGAASSDTSAATAPAGSAIISFDHLVEPGCRHYFYRERESGGRAERLSGAAGNSVQPDVLQLVNVSKGPMLSQDGQAVALVNRDDSMMESCRLSRRDR